MTVAEKRKLVLIAHLTALRAANGLTTPISPSDIQFVGAWWGSGFLYTWAAGGSTMEYYVLTDEELVSGAKATIDESLWNIAQWMIEGHLSGTSDARQEQAAKLVAIPDLKERATAIREALGIHLEQMLTEAVKMQGAADIVGAYDGTATEVAGYMIVRVL